MFGLLVSGCARRAAPEVVARVGDVAILRSTFEEAVQRRLERLHGPAGQLPDGTLARLRSGVLQRLIDDTVVQRKAQELGIEVDEAQVQRQLAAQKERFLTPDAYATYLQRAQTDDGALQDELRRSLLHEQVVAKLAGPVSVSDAEVRAFYQANRQHYRQPPMLRAQRIVVAVPPQADAALAGKQLREARRLRQAALRSPGAFADLARKHSAGAEAAHGGDMGGLFPEGHLPADLDSAVMALEPNQISLPLRTRQGWEIVELLDKKPARDVPYSEVEDSLRKSLLARQRATRIRQVEDELRRSLPVEILINLAPSDAAAAAPQDGRAPPAAAPPASPTPEAPPSETVVPPVPQPPAP